MRRRRAVRCCGLDHASLVMADHNPFRRESLLQHGDRLAWFGAATHEDIESRVAAFGPGVNADMAFSEHGDAADATASGDGVEMDVQKGRSRGLYRVSHRGLDARFVIEPHRLPEVDDEMV